MFAPVPPNVSRRQSEKARLWLRRSTPRWRLRPRTPDARLGSLRRDPGRAHDPAPLLAFAIDVACELLAGAGRRLQAVLGEIGIDPRILEHLHELAIPVVEDLDGRLAGCHERGPVDGFEVRIPGLRDGRHVAHEGRAPGARRRERAELPGLDVRLTRGRRSYVHGYSPPTK